MAEPTPDFAAEHALGLLEGDELATARRLMLSDVDFARAVDEWRHRLAPLMADMASLPVPDHIWPAIERQLVGQLGTDNAVTTLRRSNPWKTATWVSGGIAAALAAFLVFGQPSPAPIIPPQPDTMMIAQLSGDDMVQPVVASFNADKSMLKIKPADHPTPGRSTELWIIPEGGKPSSLGVVSLDKGGEMPVAPAHRSMFHDRATLAISVEPMGGSPTGAPTGPVIAAGGLTSI